MLECHWDHPSMGERTIIWTPRRKLVRFDELTLDRVGQRAFYVDTDRIEAELKRQLAGPLLSEQLEALWLDYEAFQGRERPSLIETRSPDAGSTCPAVITIPWWVCCVPCIRPSTEPLLAGATSAFGTLPTMCSMPSSHSGGSSIQRYRSTGVWPHSKPRTSRENGDARSRLGKAATSVRTMRSIP